MLLHRLDRRKHVSPNSHISGSNFLSKSRECVCHFLNQAGSGSSSIPKKRQPQFGNQIIVQKNTKNRKTNRKTILKKVANFEKISQKSRITLLAFNQ
jgi:hypothetical protein